MPQTAATGPDVDHADDVPGPADGATLRWPLVATVVLVTAIAPLATDLYVPAFPRVAGDLGGTATQVQLTLTTFFAGMALGQLVGGPVSDRHGRRGPLVAGLVVVSAASVVCALTPGIAVMLLARFAQGFAGGWAMVVARAVVVAVGVRLVRVLNVIAAVGGVAPVLAPLVGGALLQVSGWRAGFWLVAGSGVAMALATARTVPAAPRVGGRTVPGGTTAAVRTVLRSREYVGYLLVAGAVMGALFAYVATSAFVLQTMNGMSPMAYSVDFAVNAGGMTIAALAAARLAGRMATRNLVLAGLLVALAAGVIMLVSALWLGTPLVVALGCFFALMCAVGLVVPNAGALASAAVPDHPGAGSAVLGFSMWVAAGTMAPLAGLGGQHTAVPMALLMTLGAGVALTALLALTPSAGS
jgi:DHA1 family bicyclomycin/chloramphenicol resistance-like MFS transporter